MRGSKAGRDRRQARRSFWRSAAAAPRQKLTYEQRTLKDYMRGEWKGNGDVKEGLMQGRAMQLHLTFATGDFSDAKVTIESQESRIQFITSNAKTRAIYFRLFYNPSGSLEMPILCTAEFDLSYTTIRGTFKASFGSGPFSIAKEVPPPDPTRMKGIWTCVLTPQPATKARVPLSFELTFQTGAFDKTCTVSKTSDDAVRVLAIKPSLYEEAKRSIDICFTC